MKRGLVGVAGLAGLLVLLAIGYWRGVLPGIPASGTGTLDVKRSGKAAVQFELPDPDGKKRSLESFRGEAVVLHFWASWCPPCIEEIPGLIEFAKKVAGKHITILAVSLDEKREDAQKVLSGASLPNNLVSLLDPSQEVPRKYGTFQYPESYLISRDQRIVTKLVGPQEWGSEELSRAVLRLAGEE